MPGAAIFEIEVTNISPRGFWLLLGGVEELHLSFEDFPWFKTATIDELCEVQRPTENHLYWPKLDVDISVESIRDPAAFPLKSRTVA
jgi:hypothetical protein